MKPAKTSKVSTKARRVAGLRRRIGASFNLRGTSRRFIFSTSKNKRATQSPHVYYVSPFYKLNSKEWTKRLHATVHAAVSRGLEHGDLFIRNIDWTGKNLSYLDLPAIMVLTGDVYGIKAKTGKHAFLIQRSIGKTLNPKSKFDVSPKPRREIYEEASVHGQRKTTFIEHEMGSTGLGERLEVHSKKLFEVAMTKKEFKEAVNRINKRLKAKGLPSLEGLKEMVKKGKKKEAFQMARKSTGQKKLILTRETTPMTPDLYLFYQEAARILTNKLIKKAAKLIEQAPELSAKSRKPKQ